MRQENATLTEDELAACRPTGSGRRVRAYCPFHGSDNQRSLSIDRETGRFNCFNCGSWGYLKEKRLEFQRDRQSQQLPQQRYISPSNRRKDLTVLSAKEEAHGKLHLIDSAAAVEVSPVSTEIIALYDQYREALRGSTGEKYLLERGISVDTAEKYGLGYSAYGKWAHRGSGGKPVRDWKGGRLVFPHTDPQGNIINLYGRAIGGKESVPKELRHDHLPGPKGYFNGSTLNPNGKTRAVYVCEGAFDAISLIEAGYSNAVAIFGVYGWRWEWARFIERMYFAFDLDEGGGQWKSIAEEAVLRGREIYYLPEEVYAGYKDLSEAWRALKKLKIDEP